MEHYHRSSDLSGIWANLKCYVGTEYHSTCSVHVGQHEVDHKPAVLRLNTSVSDMSDQATHQSLLPAVLLLRILMDSCPL